MSSSKQSPKVKVEQRKEISASGKKLVQATLGFQPLKSPASSSTSSAKLFSNPTGEDKKRKLSYSSEEDIVKKALRSDLKENLEKSLDSKIIILFSDNDEDDQHSSQKIPKGNGFKQSKGSKKLVIKLPIAKEKKKKRKKNQLNKSIDDSENSISDAEKNEKINPVKKIKLDKSVKKSAGNESEILQKNEKYNTDQVCSRLPLTSANELIKSQNSNTTVNGDGAELNSETEQINLTCSITNNEIDNNKIVTDLIGKDLNNDSQLCKNILVVDKESAGKSRKHDSFQAAQEEKSNKVEIVEVTDEENLLTKNKAATELCTGNQLNKEPLTPVILSKKIVDSKTTTPNSTRTRNKSITPTQKRRSEKQIAKDLQKIREKEEREEQKRRENVEREQKRKEKEEREALKKKERDEKEEMRRKEKEEREIKKQAELEVKIEEKRQKEEERRKREEEKRKKELEKEELENRKKKAAEAFTKFFVAPKIITKAIDKVQDSIESSKSECLAFMPFQIKGDMKLAPLYRKKMTSHEKDYLEKYLNTSSEIRLYLDIMGSSSYKPLKSSRTLIKDEDRDEVIVIEDELQGVGQAIDVSSRTLQKYRAKFFLFCDNRRPPYHGTWRKKSAIINARKPFAIDKVNFDYEVESDEEWEEEEPGESLRGSDDEKESEDEYEVDNDFFVPHGHLSEEELQDDDENIEINTPQNQKAKLKILQQEFAQEMKKKTEKIKPKLIGIFWSDEHGHQGIDCPEIIWNSLNKRAMILAEPFSLKVENSLQIPSSPSQNKKIIRKNEFPEAFICDLIRLLHGNRNSKNFLIKEFLVFVANKERNESGIASDYTKSSIRDKIDEISIWERNNFYRLVLPDILIKYELQNLSFLNQWSYISVPKIKSGNNSMETKHENKSVKKRKTTSKNLNLKKNTNNLTNKDTAIVDSDSKSGKCSEITNSIAASPEETLKNKNEAITQQQTKNSSISSFLIKEKMENKADLANNFKKTKNIEDVVIID